MNEDQFRYLEKRVGIFYDVARYNLGESTSIQLGPDLWVTLTSHMDTENYGQSRDNYKTGLVLDSLSYVLIKWGFNTVNVYMEFNKPDCLTQEQVQSFRYVPTPNNPTYAIDILDEAAALLPDQFEISIVMKNRNERVWYRYLRSDESVTNVMKGTTLKK